MAKSVQDQEIRLKDKVDVLFAQYQELLRSDVAANGIGSDEQQALDRLSEKLQQLRKLSDEETGSQKSNSNNGDTIAQNALLDERMSKLMAELVELRGELGDIASSSGDPEQEDD